MEHFLSKQKDQDATKFIIFTSQASNSIRVFRLDSVKSNKETEVELIVSIIKKSQDKEANYTVKQVGLTVAKAEFGIDKSYNGYVYPKDDKIRYIIDKSPILKMLVPHQEDKEKKEQTQTKIDVENDKKRKVEKAEKAEDDVEELKKKIQKLEYEISVKKMEELQKQKEFLDEDHLRLSLETSPSTKSNVRELARRGIFPPSEREVFNTLPKDIKGKYMSPELFSNVKYAYHTPKGTLQSGTLCALYKVTGKERCKSVTNKSIDNEVKLITKFASFVHVSHFENYEFRCMNSDESVKRLLNYAICGECKRHYDETFKNERCYINIHSRTQNCSICKINNSQVKDNRSKSEIPACNRCIIGDNFVPRVLTALNLLKSVFGKYNIKISVEETTRSEENRNRFADIVVRFERSNIRGVIIIEIDESMHKANVKSTSSSSNMKKGKKDDVQEDEKKKFIQQSANLLHKESSSIDVIKHEEVKMMFIRFNPSGKYQTCTKKQKDVIKDSKGVIKSISAVARVFILRQWIIWYMLECTHVRSFLTLYMFYDADKTYLYPYSHPGTAFIFNAPKPVGDDTDWMYSLDISEVISKKQKKKGEDDDLLTNIIDSRISPNKVFNYEKWKKSQESEEDIYPAEISKLVHLLELKAKDI